MARARDLLATDQPLGQIAVACGLSDQAHFTKLFHREMGCPPGVWRRERRGGVLVERRAWTARPFSADAR
jgi:AraC-like DNA-binding protein